MALQQENSKICFIESESSRQVFEASPEHQEWGWVRNPKDCGNAKNGDSDGESEVSCKKASKKFRLYPLFTPMLMELPDDPVKSDSTELENDILPSVQQKLQDDPSQEIQSTVIKAGKFTLEDSFRVLKLAMNQNTSVGFEERKGKR